MFITSAFAESLIDYNDENKTISVNIVSETTLTDVLQALGNQLDIEISIESYLSNSEITLKELVINEYPIDKAIAKITSPYCFKLFISKNKIPVSLIVYRKWKNNEDFISLLKRKRTRENEDIIATDRIIGAGGKSNGLRHGTRDWDPGDVSKMFKWGEYNQLGFERWIHRSDNNKAQIENDSGQIKYSAEDSFFAYILGKDHHSSALVRANVQIYETQKVFYFDIIKGQLDNDGDSIIDYITVLSEPAEGKYAFKLNVDTLPDFTEYDINDLPDSKKRKSNTRNYSNTDGWTFEFDVLKVQGDDWGSQKIINHEPIDEGVYLVHVKGGDNPTQTGNWAADALLHSYYSEADNKARLYLINGEVDDDNDVFINSVTFIRSLQEGNSQNFDNVYYPEFTDSFLLEPEQQNKSNSKIIADVLPSHLLYSPEDFTWDSARLQLVENGNEESKPFIRNKYNDEGTTGSIFKDKPGIPDNQRIPIIFVHGWQGTKDNAFSILHDYSWDGVFNVDTHLPGDILDQPVSGEAYWRNLLTHMYKYHQKDFKYFKPYIYHYPTYKHVTFNGRIFKELLDQLETKDECIKNALLFDNFIIVAHSMGTIVSRSLMEENNFIDEVLLFISLAGVHHGSPGAMASFVDTSFIAGKNLFTPGSCDLMCDNYDGLITDDIKGDIQSQLLFSEELLDQRMLAGTVFTNETIYNTNKDSFDLYYIELLGIDSNDNPYVKKDREVPIFSNPWLLYLNKQFYETIKQKAAKKYIYHAGFTIWPDFDFSWDNTLSTNTMDGVAMFVAGASGYNFIDGVVPLSSGLHNFSRGRLLNVNEGITIDVNYDKTNPMPLDPSSYLNEDDLKDEYIYKYTNDSNCKARVIYDHDHDRMLNGGYSDIYEYRQNGSSGIGYDNIDFTDDHEVFLKYYQDVYDPHTSAAMIFQNDPLFEQIRSDILQSSLQTNFKGRQYLIRKNGVELNPLSRSYLGWPFEGVADSFYFTDLTNNYGQYFANQSFFSPLDGTVIFVGGDDNDKQGKQVIIQSSDNQKIAFVVTHLKNITIVKDQAVQTGDTLGVVDSKTFCELYYGNVSSLQQGGGSDIQSIPFSFIHFNMSNDRLSRYYYHDPGAWFYHENAEIAFYISDILWDFWIHPTTRENSFMIEKLGFPVSAPDNENLIFENGKIYFDKTDNNQLKVELFYFMKGIVVDYANQPINGIVVQLFENDTVDPILSFETASDGMFSFQKEDINPSSNYYLSVADEGYETYDSRDQIDSLAGDNYYEIPIILFPRKTLVVSTPEKTKADGQILQGEITISTLDIQDTDLEITLSSSDSTFITLHSTMILPASSNTAPFSIYVQDTEVVTPQEVIITAASSDWHSGSDTINMMITDNYWPYVDFGYTIDGSTVTFQDKSTDDGEIVHRVWQFGDGQTSNETHPTHQYQEAKTYIVELDVTDNKGATSGIAAKIMVGLDITFGDNASHESTIFFGETNITCKNEVSIKISDTNLDEKDLSISTISGNADDFHYFFNDQSLLKQSQSLYLTAIFEPLSAGEKTLTIEISNNKDSEVETIILQGTGVIKNCNDNNPCTTDYYANCRCHYKPIEHAPCEECRNGAIVPKNCEDGDPCTDNWCDNGWCKERIRRECVIINKDPTYIQYALNNHTPDIEVISHIFSPSHTNENHANLELTYDVQSSSLISILIYDTEGNLIRSLLKYEKRTTGQHTDIWDGLDDNGIPVEDGTYKFIINGVNIRNAMDYWTHSDQIVVDSTLPVAKISAIKSHSPEYNHFTIWGTASDDHFQTYYLECFNYDHHVYIAYEKAAVKNADLGSFDASTLDDGTYTLRITVNDQAGNVSIAEKPLVIDRQPNLMTVHVNAVNRTTNLAQEGYVETSDSKDVWIDDELPEGTTVVGDWQWDTGIAYSGIQSHTAPIRAGKSVHYFIHADQTLSLTSEDNIIQYVYLDPDNTPQELLLQFYTDDGNGEHRAYWGSNQVVTDGQSGSASLYAMGMMPVTGKWVRLKIPASVIGLSGKEVKGMAFITYNGRAWWDKTTISSSYNDTQEDSWNVASNITEDDTSETIISYSTSKDSYVLLTVYDNQRNAIQYLVNEYLEAGTWQAKWDGTDWNGNQVPFGRYHFQFTTLDDIIDSNVYALMPKTSASDITPVQNLVDTHLSSYTIVNHVIHKTNANASLAYTLTAENLGHEQLTPTTLFVDLNDNLFIVDASHSRIFKLNAYGHVITQLPDTSSDQWQQISMNIESPAFVSVDDAGDLIIGNKNGTEQVELSVGCFSIDHGNITAEIRVPYENSLVYATVPVFGTASARDFKNYVVEYGAGDDPQVWNIIASSNNKVFDDYKPIPPSLTIFGNVASWDTYPPLPKGVYTIRLTVFDNDGNSFNDKVVVNVATLIERWGGTVLSNDGLVQLSIPRGAIASDADLFCINDMKNEEAPAVDDPELTQIGKIYQFLPANYKFLSTCTLKMFYTDEQLGDI